MAAMITWAQARPRIVRSYQRHAATWAAQMALAPDAVGLPLEPSPPVVALSPPSQAEALANQAEAIAWVEGWRRIGDPTVEWVTRQWASLGTQELPTRLAPSDAIETARICGQVSEFKTMVGRAREILESWGTAGSLTKAEVAAGLRRHLRIIAALDQADWRRLRACVEWLAVNRESGLYPRQVPVRGVDSKWIERHRGLIAGLLQALTGQGELGLATAPALIRVRFLDPDLAPGGLRDLAAPVTELDRLAIKPSCIIVLENLQSLLALPNLPGCVAVHGGGYGVEVLGDIGWLRDSRLLYWGDLDVDGFAILSQLRGRIPTATSILMDQATLEAHRDLTVPDSNRATTCPANLTPAEQATWRTVALSGRRLEQERISWKTVIAAIQ